MSETKTNFKDRFKAEDAVCQAFVKLGVLADVDVESGAGPADLDADLIEACYQANFSDPHFLGGPCCFNHATSLSHVDKIFTPAFDVSNRLIRFIAERNDPVKMKAAEDAAEVIRLAKQWLVKVVNAA